MNENIEKLLETAVTKGLEIAEKTGEFVIEQSPILLKEFYSWHTVTSIAWVLSCLTLVFISYQGIKIAVKNKWDDEGAFILGVFGYIGVFGFSVGVIISALELVKILVAPRLYLIEFFVK